MLDVPPKEASKNFDAQLARLKILTPPHPHRLHFPMVTPCRCTHRRTDCVTQLSPRLLWTVVLLWGSGEGVTETTVATAALRSRGLTPDVVFSTVVAVAMMSRRSPKALPPGNAACCSGKLNYEESKQYESEQEDVSVSIEPKKKVKLGIMSFYKKKQKKRGRGRPRKVPPPLPYSLQRCRRWMSQRLIIGIKIIITVTQQWLPHGWAVEFYISTGGKFPTQPIINILKRVIKRDAEKLSHNNKQKNK